jgi:vacuolar-type H+-ATPase subunit F/Vma7
LDNPCVFIGDEVCAAGFRLAGVTCYTPAAAEVTALFQRLRGEAGMILITAEYARHVPERALAEAQREQHPLLLVIADIRDRAVPADMASALKRQLGLAE